MEVLCPSRNGISIAGGVEPAVIIS
jgi:hypothetical protein